MRTRLLALPLGGALLAVSLLLPGIASAHEQRDVGSYHFVVGFLNEPSIADQMNGLDLTITTTADKKPVEGAEKTLKAEVIVGGNAKVMPLPLTARFGMPGKYAAYFMPTAAGAYIFHISGTINGDTVDQRFESGPGRLTTCSRWRRCSSRRSCPIRPRRRLSWPARSRQPARDARSASPAWWWG